MKRIDMKYKLILRDIKRFSLDGSVNENIIIKTIDRLDKSSEQRLFLLTFFNQKKKDESHDHLDKPTVKKINKQADLPRNFKINVFRQLIKDDHLGFIISKYAAVGKERVT